MATTRIEVPTTHWVELATEVTNCLAENTTLGADVWVQIAVEFPKAEEYDGHVIGELNRSISFAGLGDMGVYARAITKPVSLVVSTS